MTLLAWLLVANLAFNAFILAHIGITEYGTPSRREMALALPTTALFSGAIALAVITSTTGPASLRCL